MLLCGEKQEIILPFSITIVTPMFSPSYIPARDSLLADATCPRHVTPSAVVRCRSRATGARFESLYLCKMNQAEMPLAPLLDSWWRQRDLPLRGINFSSLRDRKGHPQKRMSFSMVETKGFARLRAGRVAALACPRHAIHSRSLRIPSNLYMIQQAEASSDASAC